jgi:hypothetical protein
MMDAVILIIAIVWFAAGWACRAAFEALREPAQDEAGQ